MAQPKPRKHQPTVSQILRQPLSSPLAALVGHFVSTLLWRLWMLLPSVVRRAIHRRVDLSLALSSQALFGLRLDPKVRFFRQSMLDKEVVTIDGVKLKSTHLYPHSDEEDIPRACVIMRTPYFRKFDVPIARLLCERGFHVLVQDTRGRFESEGNADLGVDEKRDAGCTLRWLSQQPWFDGRVICIGISIGGYTTWATCAAAADKLYRVPDQPVGKPVKIVAVFPLFTSADIIRRGLFHDGLQPRAQDNLMRLDLSTKYASFMWTLLHSSHVMGSPLAWVGYTIIKWQVWCSSQDFFKRQLHLPLRDVDESVIGEVPHPRVPIIEDPADPLWSLVDHSHVSELIGSGVPLGDGDEPPAIMFCSGWYDIFAEETIRDYKACVAAHKAAVAKGGKGNSRIFLCMGPYSHFNFETFFPPTIRECIRVLDDVFSDLHPPHHFAPLKDKPAVTAFCMGAGGFFPHRVRMHERVSTNAWSPITDSCHAWRFYSQWPPVTAKACRLVLQSRGRLVHTKEAVAGGGDAFVWDPASPTPTLGGATFSMFSSGPAENSSVEGRTDTLVYTTAPSHHDVDFAGMVVLRVWLWSTAVSADVACRLSLVDPRDLASISILDGIARYTLDVRTESWPRLVEVRVGNVCAQVAKGWRLRCTIAGGSFPQFSRNLGYGESLADATRMTQAEHRVSFSEAGEFSHLELPIVGGAEELDKAFA